MHYNRNDQDTPEERAFNQWKRNESWIRSYKRSKVIIFVLVCITELVFVPMIFKDNIEVTITTGRQSITPMIGAFGSAFTALVGFACVDALNDKIAYRIARQKSLATRLAMHINSEDSNADVSPSDIMHTFQSLTHKRVL